MTYQESEDYLLSNYFDSNNSSDVTSSHWKEIGAHEALKSVSGSLMLKGFGFGNFRKSTIFKTIFHLHESLLALLICFFYVKNTSVIRNVLKIGFKSGRIIDFDLVKQAIALDKIIRIISPQNFNFLETKTICVIGDGYSAMGSLIKLMFPTSKIIFVNLGKTLLFDLHYFNKIFSQKQYQIIKGPKEIEAWIKHPTDLFIPAELYDSIKYLKIDLFINIASMQEMSIDTINKYFHYMKSSTSTEKFFYCCNRRKKLLPDGAEIIFDKYPWGDCEFLLNEKCDWYNYEPIARPPFLRKFDGPAQQAIGKWTSIP